MTPQVSRSVPKKVQDFVEGLHDVHKAVRENLVRANSKYKQDADQKRRHVDFEVGNFVWAILTKDHFSVGEYNKLYAKKIGPVEVVEKMNSNAYRLKLPSHIRCSDVFNMKHLLPYHGDSSNEDTVGVSGGPNSMALCLLAANWNTYGLNATSKGKDDVVDGLLAIMLIWLSAESKDEVEMVQRRVLNLGIRCEIAHCEWADGKPKLGHLQEAARDMRSMFEIYWLITSMIVSPNLSLVLRVEKKLFVIEQPISLASPTDSEYLRSGIRYLIHNEATCLMLGSMTPEL
ncbi:putative reverse transcriptase domain-containing protein [Tanacetum coccineum]